LEFNQANHSSVSGRSDIEFWFPPPPGVMKLNVDAGCFKDDTVGWGMVVRDHRGVVEFAVSKPERRQLSPTLTEALALRWCL